jgi:hypothetical protein
MQPENAQSLRRVLVQVELVLRDLKKGACESLAASPFGKEDQYDSLTFTAR